MTLFTFRLMEKHRRIDDALRLELNRRAPDMGQIVYLKKLKLAVKDRLASLQRSSRPLVTSH